MTDSFIWHVASNSKGWFVCRELRKANEHGIRHVYDKTERGNLRWFTDRDKAQWRADRLNKRDGITAWLTDEELAWWLDHMKADHDGFSARMRRTLRALLAEVQFTREN